MCRQDRMLRMRSAMVSRKHSSFFSLFIAHLLVGLYCIPPSACTISFTPLITAQLCEQENISCQLVCVWPQHGKFRLESSLYIHLLRTNALAGPVSRDVEEMTGKWAIVIRSGGDGTEMIRWYVSP